MNIKEALKKIVTNLGGSSTSKNIPGLINEIAENATSGGGGAEEFIATVEIDETTPANSTCDKTFSEIEAAILDGKRVVYNFKYDGEYTLVNSSGAVVGNVVYNRCFFPVYTETGITVYVADWQYAGDDSMVFNCWMLEYSTPAPVN